MKSFPGQQWAFAGMTVMDALNWKWNEKLRRWPSRAAGRRFGGGQRHCRSCQRHQPQAAHRALRVVSIRIPAGSRRAPVLILSFV